MLFVVLFCFEIVLSTKSPVANLKILYSTARSREWGEGAGKGKSEQEEGGGRMKERGRHSAEGRRREEGRSAEA